MKDRLRVFAQLSILIGTAPVVAQTVAQSPYDLVRAGNSCDAGTYGNGSALPDPRDLLDAADPIGCSTE